MAPIFFIQLLCTIKHRYFYVKLTLLRTLKIQECFYFGSGNNKMATSFQYSSLPELQVKQN